MSGGIVIEINRKMPRRFPVPGPRSSLCSGSIFSITSIVRFWRRSNRRSAPLFLRLTTSMRWRKTGSLGDAFLFTYMVSAPLLGWLADRFHDGYCRLRGALWSLASGATGLAATFAILFATRIFVGIGEGGYGRLRQRFWQIFFHCKRAAAFSHLLRGHSGRKRARLRSWRTSEFIRVGAGPFIWSLRPVCCSRCSVFSAAIRARRSRPATNGDRNRNDYVQPVSNAFVRVNTFAQTAMTFALGGLAFWMAGLS